MTKIQQVIRQSIMTDSIVFLDVVTVAEASELDAECEGSVQGHVLEWWGTDWQGTDWRVHAKEITFGYLEVNS